LLTRGGTGGAFAVTDLAALLSTNSDLIPQLLGALNRVERNAFEVWLRQFRIRDGFLQTRLYVLRTEARVFGWSAPAIPIERIGPEKAKDLFVGAVPCPAAPAACSDPCKAAWTAQCETVRTNIRQEIDKYITKSVSNDRTIGPKFEHQVLIAPEAEAERATCLRLDGAHKNIHAGDVLAIRKKDEPQINGYFVESAVTRPRTAYDISGECTDLELADENGWWSAKAGDFEVIRTTRVYCDGEVLEPLEEDLSDPMIHGSMITLDTVAVGLDSTRPLIVEGVTFAEDADGVPVREFLGIAGIQHKVDDHTYGDRFRTTITLDRPLLHTYRRDSVKIYANVVEATHGETHREILGAGDGAREFLELSVRRERVSQVPAPTPRGVERALAVSVNNVRWSEREQLHDAGPDELCYGAHVADTEVTSVIFGDGAHGVRPPTGQDNIRAVYRSGLGALGNVKAGQIDQVVGAPLGVKGVINPLPATGGAEPDSLQKVRARAPLAITAMDRLVSTQDYADFAINFGGISKATVERRGRVVHVTVAGTVPDPLQFDGPLLRNLEQALRLAGDPRQQFELHPHRSSLLVIVAKIAIDPRREWALIETDVRTAVQNAFDFENADFGKDALLSALISTIQCVPGVEYVDVDKFDAVQSEYSQELAKKLESLDLRARIKARALESVPLVSPGPDGDRTNGVNSVDEHNAEIGTEPSGGGSANGKPVAMQLVGAELIYLTPDVPDTLVLEQIP
jgi:hypothetical protein